MMRKISSIDVVEQPQLEMLTVCDIELPRIVYSGFARDEIAEDAQINLEWPPVRPNPLSIGQYNQADVDKLNMDSVECVLALNWVTQSNTQGFLDRENIARRDNGILYFLLIRKGTNNTYEAEWEEEHDDMYGDELIHAFLDQAKSALGR
jgi:hypothetical protein